MMKVLHVTASLSRLGGGIPPVVWELARHQSAAGAAASVAGLQDRYTAEDARPDVPYRAAVSTGPAAFGYSRELGKLLHDHRADVVHSHGLWMHPGIEARRLARRSRAALVVSPHGMLEPWAIRRSRLRKLAAAWLFERSNVRSAGCVHALCRQEAAGIRAFSPRSAIAVVPNGVDLRDWAAMPGREAIAERFPEVNGRRRALFLSRIHPKKGLAHLLEAWARLGRLSDGWVLVVSGPDEGGHLRHIESLAESLGISRSVVFTGPLYGQAKLEALAGADVFVLPSFSEGFSIAVLEAAACRLPVLLTAQCNFPELAAAGGAVEVEPTAEGTLRGLRLLAGMTDAQRMEMGANGRTLVEFHYTWDAIATKMVDVYSWLLGGGPAPACVMQP